MNQRVYGYIRVSTKEQKEARQIIALSALDIPKSNIYIDKQSGKDFERPQYKKLMKRLRSQDLLVIQSIDRLGRNYDEILEQWKYITKIKKADIRVLDMPLLDTTMSKDLIGTLIADLVLQLLSFMAQREREMIRSRQAEGIAAAKARGVRFGRPPKPIPENFYQICSQWNLGYLSTSEASNALRMPTTTFLRKARAFLEAN